GMARDGGGMPFHDCNRRSGGSENAYLLSDDGHDEGGEESPPYGAECQRRVRGAAENPQIAGRQGGRSPFAAGGGQAEGLGRASAVRGGTVGVLGRPAGPRRERVLRPMNHRRR